MPDAKIIPAHCVKTAQAFDVHVERDGDDTWCFAKGVRPMPSAASNAMSLVSQFGGALPATTQGNSESLSLQGKFRLGDDFACPHCANPSIFQCNACGGTINCYDGTSNIVTCASCGESGAIAGFISSTTATDAPDPDAASGTLIGSSAAAPRLLSNK